MSAHYHIVNGGTFLPVKPNTYEKGETNYCEFYVNNFYVRINLSSRLVYHLEHLYLVYLIIFAFEIQNNFGSSSFSKVLSDAIHKQRPAETQDYLILAEICKEAPDIIFVSCICILSNSDKVKHPLTRSLECV